jgi:hypothetical protein
MTLSQRSAAALRRMTAPGTGPMAVPLSVGALFGLACLVLLSLPLKWAFASVFSLALVCVLGAGFPAKPILLVFITFGLMSRWLGKGVFIGGLFPFLSDPEEQFFFDAIGIFVAVACVVWVRDLAFSRTDPVEWLPRVNLPLAILVMLSAASIVGGIAPERSFNAFLKLLQHAVMYFYLANQVRRPRDARFVLFGILALLAGECALSYYQFLTGRSVQFAILAASKSDLQARTLATAEEGSRYVRGTFGHPNETAEFFLAFVPFALAGMLALKVRWLRIVCGALALLGIGTLGLTLSRLALLSLPIAIVVAILKTTGGREARRMLFSGRMIGVCLLMLAPLVVFAPAFYTRFTRGNDISSGMAHLYSIRMGMMIADAHPVLGIGFGAYEQALPAIIGRRDDLGLELHRYAVEHSRRDNRWLTWAEVHSIYFRIAAETGWPAMLCYVWFLVNLGRLGMRANVVASESQRVLAAGSLAALLSIAFLNILQAGKLTAPLCWFLSGLLVATSTALGEERPTSQVAARRPSAEPVE